MHHKAGVILVNIKTHQQTPKIYKTDSMSVRARQNLLARKQNEMQPCSYDTDNMSLIIHSRSGQPNIQNGILSPRDLSSHFTYLSVSVINSWWWK